MATILILTNGREVRFADTTHTHRIDELNQQGFWVADQWEHKDDTEEVDA